MNINSTPDSTQPHIIQPQPMPPSIKPTAPNKYKLRDVFTDQFHPEQFQTLAKASKENPDVRPDVIAAAKQFVTDPNYPTPAQLSQLAKMVVGGGTDSALPASTKSSTTQPPMTEPPMTYPPMTEPPTIEPVTVSAASQTQPPMTEPPMTEPPMTYPPMIEPPTIEPVTVSAASQQKE